MVLKDGETVAEGYWKPIERDEPHRLFSVSKTMTALAIGMLMGDGKIALSDRIVTYFPELLPDKVPPELDKLVIHDMLRMATCFNAATYCLEDINWAATFFAAKPTQEPGTAFFYDTSASQVLCALVEKLAGEEILSFLQRRLFDHLGMTGKKHWLKDPSGISQGGSGLCMTLTDFAKVTNFMMTDGLGLVPSWFMEAAVKKQTETLMQASDEEKYGYGYQLWRTRNGFSMYGMGGQMGICVPEKRLCLCTLADTQLDPRGVQKIYDGFFEQILPDADRLEQRFFDKLQIPVLQNNADYAVETKGPYRMKENPMGVTAIELKKNAFTYERGNQWHTLPFAFSEYKKGTFPGGKEPCITCAGWVAPHTLQIRSHVIGDTPCGMEAVLVFKNNSVTFHTKAVWDPITGFLNGVASGYQS